MQIVQHGIFFPLTTPGIEAAEQQLQRLKQAVGASSVSDGGSSEPPRPTNATMPAIVLYEATDPNHRSREFIAALDQQPRTFAELSPKIRANDDGTPLTAAQVRAVFRNVKRQENSLIKAGKLRAAVVQSDFDHYDRDNAGRYYLAPGDLAALDHHLGR